MTKNLFVSAICAGIAAGLLASALQLTFVIPVLLEGELYETGARVHFGTDGSPQSDRGAPTLAGDWLRHSMTVAFNIVTYTGYGLLLAAMINFASLKGITTTAKQGLIWGLCGYIAVQLAPAIGLPPELPGTIAAEVGQRQLWWISTILASAAGLGLIAFGRSYLPLAGVVLMATPHLLGAPHLDTFFGVAPPELAAEFATLSLAAAAAGWVLLGYAVAAILQRLER
jgi:cobalt transporter subunit CbtA